MMMMMLMMMMIVMIIILVITIMLGMMVKRMEGCLGCAWTFLGSLDLPSAIVKPSGSGPRRSGALDISIV
eukprot:4054815-Pyramimonas_sp.AAC.1